MQTGLSLKGLRTERLRNCHLASPTPRVPHSDNVFAIVELKLEFLKRGLDIEGRRMVAGSSGSLTRLTASSEMLYVIFSNPGMKPDQEKLVCGPYRAVEIIAGHMIVTEGLHHFALAYQEGTAWKGVAENGVVYHAVLISERPS
jgi:hypothetical protein